MEMRIGLLLPFTSHNEICQAYDNCYFQWMEDLNLQINYMSKFHEIVDHSVNFVQTAQWSAQANNME